MLERLRRNWDAFGRIDPLWSILTLPGTERGHWDVEAFFETGRAEVRRVLAYLNEVAGPIGRGRALDFGCGVGRVTQALGAHYAQVDGVDIAESMIELARRSNRSGRRCRYHVHAADDLSLFASGTFDLVYCSYVLQHIEPEPAERYVREFVRVLAPGGVAAFQIVTDPVPGASAPLAEGAYRAAIRVEPDRLVAEPGSAIAIEVSVANRGTARWPAVGNRDGFGVSIANRWFDEHGDLVVTDDARARLPHDLGPGEEIISALVVGAPEAPGTYALEIDVVQEGVAWFGDRGSATARVPCRVKARRWRRSRRGSSPAAGGPAPEMEMHGIPPAAAASWVEDAGGRVVSVGEILSAGREVLLRDWNSSLVVVARADRPA
jgi:SAM-dependent methyltransferase